MAWTEIKYPLEGVSALREEKNISDIRKRHQMQNLMVYDVVSPGTCTVVAGSERSAICHVTAYDVILARELPTEEGVQLTIT